MILNHLTTATSTLASSTIPNKKESNRIGEPQMDNRIQLDQGTRRAPRERDG